MKNEIKVGNMVRLLSNDSNHFRTGEVVEIQELTPGEKSPLFKKLRYRVRWTHESDGTLIKKSGKVQSVRTWCQRQRIELI